MAKGKPKDENIVVYYDGKYYEVPPSVWKIDTLLLGKDLSQFAKKLVIDKGDEVGYVPAKVTADLTGGYSTVVNLSAVLKRNKELE